LRWDVYCAGSYRRSSYGFGNFGISVITDIGDEDNIDTNHDEVLEAAQKAEPNVRSLIKELILQY
jgi:purine nucleoside phosphorylase